MLREKEAIWLNWQAIYYNLTFILIKTAIVILNWNGKKLLEKFLPILINNTPINSEVWIIDNYSTDGSVDFLNKQFPEIQLVCLDKNYGFTGGYNRGLDSINAEYYLLLNSDIEVTEDWLNPLIEEMDNNPETGICGPKLLDYNKRDFFEYAGASGGLIDKYGYPFCRGRIFESIEMDKGQYNDNLSCLWISGAALMIRAELFKKVGGFDDDFFAHMEEIDLCWRIQNLGYRILCVPNSFVYHVGGATLSKHNSRKTYYNFRNNLSLLLKNLPRKQLFRVLFIRIFLDKIASFRMLMQGNFNHFFALIKAYIHFMASIRKILKKRRKLIRKNTKELDGFYQKSIVFRHYLKGIKKYSDL